MKKPLLAILLACLLLLSLSQGMAKQQALIRGTVLNPDGKPAPGVKVRVVSRSAVTNAVTDRDGRFSIKLAPPKGGYG